MSNSELLYDGTADQELFLSSHLSVGGKRVDIDAATIAGSRQKPNEDAFAISKSGGMLLVGIFDGSTSLKPIDALGDQTGARFASHLLKDKFAQLNASLAPKSLLLELNRMLLHKCLDFGDVRLDDVHSLPNSGATIIKIDLAAGELTSAHVGDAYGIAFYDDGHSELLTDDKVHPFDERLFTLARQIAKEKGITNREARDDPRVKQALIDMYQERNNNPNGKGSGFVNGDPNVELYVYETSLSLQGVQAILLGTDGLTPQGWSVENEQDKRKLLVELQAGGMQRLMAAKHQSEDDDPDWQYARFKHSDDATGVFVTFQSIS